MKIIRPTPGGPRLYRVVGHHFAFAPVECGGFDRKPCIVEATEAIMNEDAFNASIRKFLKTLGVSAQREIEKAVRRALAEGKLKGNEKIAAEARVTLGRVGLSHEIKGEIELE
jgi:hypothetical protein